MNKTCNYCPVAPSFMGRWNMGRSGISTGSWDSSHQTQAAQKNPAFQTRTLSPVSEQEFV